MAKKQEVERYARRSAKGLRKGPRIGTYSVPPIRISGPDTLASISFKADRVPSVKELIEFLRALNNLHNGLALIVFEDQSLPPSKPKRPEGFAKPLTAHEFDFYSQFLNRIDVDPLLHITSITTNSPWTGVAHVAKILIDPLKDLAYTIMH